MRHNMKKRFSYIVFLRLVVSYTLLGTHALAETQTMDPTMSLQGGVPAHYLVKAIQVTGNTSIDREAILAYAGLKVGDIVQIPGPTITDAIKRLWKQKLINHVAIYAAYIADNQVELTIHVKESARLAGYCFEGIKKREQDRLVKKISLTKGKLVTDDFIKNTKQTIQTYWIEKGYLNAKVVITAIPDATRPKHTQLRIKIDTGKKLSINSIQFVGNRSVHSDVLSEQMQHLHEQPRFTFIKHMMGSVLSLQPIRKEGMCWRLFNPSEVLSYYKKHVILRPARFSDQKLEADKLRIINYYRSKGFRDVVIKAATVDQHEGNALNVKIQVEEGKQYRVGNIKWVGNYLYDNEILQQILDVKKGDLYNLPLLQQRLISTSPKGEDIASLYMDDGYLFFQANIVEVGLVDNVVDLEIRIQEGPQVCINKVIIEDNKITHDDVIRRELRTLPGDKFSRAKIQRSYRELVQLGILDPIMDIVPEPNFAKKTVDIKYKVKEQPKFEVKASGGWEGGGDFVGQLTLSTNNFSFNNLVHRRKPIGGYQNLAFEAELNGKGRKKVSLKFTEPWLGGRKPRSLHVGASKSFVDKRSSTGAQVELGTRLTWPDDYMVLKGGLSYYQHDYEDYDLINNSKRCSGSLQEFTINISLERDSTDNPIYPKAGSRLALHANVTLPWSSLINNATYSWKEYHQWLLDGMYSLRLVDNLVFHVRGHFGVLGKFLSQEDIGPFQRFYLGGTRQDQDYPLIGKEHVMLRGYEKDYIAPKDQATGYRGGVIYDKLVFELRYPIFAKNAISAYILAFAEGGYTWARYKDYNPLCMKRAAGMGIRIYIPYVLATMIGIDGGYGFDKQPTDEDYRTLLPHFSIGMNLLR